MLPQNPTLNETYTVNGRLYVYNGSRWTISGSSYSSFVTTSGTVYDSSTIPDNDEATEREQVLEYGDRVYTLINGKWVITYYPEEETIDLPGTQGLEEIVSLLTEEVGALTEQVNSHSEKFIAVDERFEGIPNSEGGFLKLESNTQPGEITGGDPTFVQEFFDKNSDGDTNVFDVSMNQRGTYSLNDVPQPSVEVPVPDIMVFNLSQLDDPTDFDIYAGGAPLEYGIIRDYDNQIITVYTSNIPETIERLFYRSKTVKGRGFTISLIRY